MSLKHINHLKIINLKNFPSPSPSPSPMGMGKGMEEGIIKIISPNKKFSINLLRIFLLYVSTFTIG